MKARKILIKLIEQMKAKQIVIVSLSFSALIFTSCEKGIPIPEQIKKVSVFMQDAKKSPTIKKMDLNEEISFKVGGVECRAETDGKLVVTLVADMSLVAKFNENNNEHCLSLVEGSYTFDNTIEVPEGGIISDSITINIRDEGYFEEGEKYLLPIRISSIDGKGRILQNSEISYIIIVVGEIVELIEYDKSGWEVVDFSSEELNGEGPVLGRAALVIDNDTKTFWHSQYTGGGSVPPHYIAVDTKEERSIRAFWILNVQEEWGDSHYAYPISIILEISTDGNEWTKVMEATGNKTREKQFFKLPSDFTARYFKISIERSELLNGEERTYAYLSEIGISYGVYE